MVPCAAFPYLDPDSRQFVGTPQMAVRQVREPVRQSDELLGRQLLCPRRLLQQRALDHVGVSLREGVAPLAPASLLLGIG